MIRISVRLAASLIMAWPAAAAAQEGSDIFLVELRDGARPAVVGEPANLTARPGYDNQPSFTPEGDAILFARIDAAGQADIYRIRLADRMVEPVTRTAPESEYSPTVMPGARRFSVVRVERDSTQRLWSFERDGSDARVVLEDVKPVGYFAWGDSATVAMFILGEPPTLQVGDARTGEARLAARSIGRSIQKIPGRRAVSFIHRVTPDVAWVSELDLDTGAIRRLVRTLEGGDAHAWTPGGWLLMGQGPKLFAWDPRNGSPLGDPVAAWMEIAGLSVANITRLAVSPDGRWLAIVGDDGREL